MYRYAHYWDGDVGSMLKTIFYNAFSCCKCMAYGLICFPFPHSKTLTWLIRDSSWVIQQVKFNLLMPQATGQFHMKLSFFFKWFWWSVCLKQVDVYLNTLLPGAVLEGLAYKHVLFEAVNTYFIQVNQICNSLRVVV